MCIDPATAFVIAGAAIGAAGDLMEGRDAKALANLEARQYENQAVAERQSSAYEAARLYDKQRYAAAEDRARLAASGVAATGSPVEVMADNAAQGQLDLEAIRYGSTLKQQALRTQAGVSRAQGQIAQRNSIFSAAGRIFSAGASIAGGMPTKSVQAGQSPFTEGRPMNLLAFRRPGIA